MSPDGLGKNRENTSWTRREDISSPTKSCPSFRSTFTIGQTSAITKLRKQSILPIRLKHVVFQAVKNTRTVLRCRICVSRWCLRLKIEYRLLELLKMIYWGNYFWCRKARWKKLTNSPTRRILRAQLSPSGNSFGNISPIPLPGLYNTLVCIKRKGSW